MSCDCSLKAPHPPPPPCSIDSPTTGVRQAALVLSLPLPSHKGLLFWLFRWPWWQGGRLCLG